MISTHRLRVQFTEYLKTGYYEQAVAVAANVPLLLDTIDTLQEALNACAQEAPRIQAQIDAMDQLVKQLQQEVASR